MNNKNPIVLSVDAGGTNFVFSAVQNGKLIGESIRKPANGHDLEKSLYSLFDGFSHLMLSYGQNSCAISFAFPGPADYENGIIGDLGNLPAYRGGIPLAPILEEKFKLPVYINNDADLFTYGEAMHGALPLLNQKLKEYGSRKSYRNLVGLTLGTGFGLGVVNHGKLLRGDNSMPSEIWLLRNPEYPEANIEESISIRGIQRTFHKLCLDKQELTPKEIFEIATSNHIDKEAALTTFRVFGKNLGDIIASLISLYDSNIVIGGGLSNAWDLFAPAMMAQLQSSFITPEGKKIPRITHQVYKLEENQDFLHFAQENETVLTLPNNPEKKLNYNSNPRVGIMKSAMETSVATMIGAYYFAIEQMDK
jgi:glucokinase